MDLMDDLVKERFGADAARELCQKPDLFEQGTLYKRIEISETLRAEFVRRGGDNNTRTNDVSLVLKKRLIGSISPFRKEIRGRYRFLGFDGATEQVLAVDAGGSAGSDAAKGDAPVPEREIGAGPCEVYAWCLPQYQATSHAHWPI